MDALNELVHLQRKLAKGEISQEEYDQSSKQFKERIRKYQLYVRENQGLPTEPRDLKFLGQFIDELKNSGMGTAFGIIYLSIYIYIFLPLSLAFLSSNHSYISITHSCNTDLSSFPPIVDAEGKRRLITMTGEEIKFNRNNVARFLKFTAEEVGNYLPEGIAGNLQYVIFIYLSINRDEMER